MTSTFIALLVILISEFDNIGPFWSVKHINFLPKATDSDSSSYFSQKLTP